MPLATVDQDVPSQCPINPYWPTTHTSDGPLPQMSINSPVAPLNTGDHDTPFQCRRVPLSPAAQTSDGPLPQSTPRYFVDPLLTEDQFLPSQCRIVPPSHSSAKSCRDNQRPTHPPRYSPIRHEDYCPEAADCSNTSDPRNKHPKAEAARHREARHREARHPDRRPQGDCPARCPSHHPEHRRARHPSLKRRRDDGPREPLRRAPRQSHRDWSSPQSQTANTHQAQKRPQVRPPRRLTSSPAKRAKNGLPTTSEEYNTRHPERVRGSLSDTLGYDGRRPDDEET